METSGEKLSPTVQVIEDEKEIAELMRYNLEREGYAVSVAHSGEDGLSQVRAKPPAVVLLDLMLPGMDGLEICRQMRRDPQFSNTRIMIVTARGDEHDIVKGLELGADDYVSKPFSPKVMTARVKALMRRALSLKQPEKDPIEMHGLRVHWGQRKAWVNDESLDLTESEFRILHLLMRRSGWVFTRGQIVRAIRGTNYAVTERSIDVQVVGLRRKLGEQGALVETVRGVGYRFKEA